MKLKIKISIMLGICIFSGSVCVQANKDELKLSLIAQDLSSVVGEKL